MIDLICDALEDAGWSCDENGVISGTGPHDSLKTAIEQALRAAVLKRWLQRARGETPYCGAV